MTLQVIGAGVGRTGTLSLKYALEQLLGEPCYHMVEAERRPDHLRSWLDAVNGERPDWPGLFEGFAATVDWPAAAFWPELIEYYPQALVILSQREEQQWWASLSETILPAARKAPRTPWRRLMGTLFWKRFAWQIDDPEAMIAAYRAHNAAVQGSVPASRLLVWAPEDGWAPLCHALACPVPDRPFPHANRRQSGDSAWEWPGMLPRNVGGS
jgi:hypothetical protein